MPPAPQDTLTAREAQLMSVLWERGPSTADQVRNSLPDAPHDSTVRTLLRVLENKGFVTHTKRGKSYVYAAVVRRAAAERNAIKSMLQRFFGGSAAALVQRLLEDETLSAEEIAALQSELEAEDKGPPNTK
jgi:predicted transcriptional regulator